jgi:hypothetical protein
MVKVFATMGRGFIQQTSEIATVFQTFFLFLFCFLKICCHAGFTAKLFFKDDFSFPHFISLKPFIILTLLAFNNFNYEMYNFFEFVNEVSVTFSLLNVTWSDEIE